MLEAGCERLEATRGGRGAQSRSHACKVELVTTARSMSRFALCRDIVRERPDGGISGDR